MPNAKKSKASFAIPVCDGWRSSIFILIFDNLFIGQTFWSMTFVLFCTFVTVHFLVKPAGLRGYFRICTERSRLFVIKSVLGGAYSAA